MLTRKVRFVLFFGPQQTETFNYFVDGATPEIKDKALALMKERGADMVEAHVGDKLITRLKAAVERPEPVKQPDVLVLVQDSGTYPKRFKNAQFEVLQNGVLVITDASTGRILRAFNRNSWHSVEEE